MRSTAARRHSPGRASASHSRSRLVALVVLVGPHAPAAEAKIVSLVETQGSLREFAAVYASSRERATSADDAYSFIARSGGALLFDPDQPVLELRRTATGGLLLAPASVLASRSVADDQARPNSKIPFSMQALARSIGRRGLPQSHARTDFMPEAGNALAARKTSLGGAAGGAQAKSGQKKTGSVDPKKMTLSKKEQDALKKKAAQKKKHGLWW